MAHTRTLVVIAVMLALALPALACGRLGGGYGPRSGSSTMGVTPPAAAPTPGYRSYSYDQPASGSYGAAPATATATPEQAAAAGATPAGGQQVKVEVFNFGFRPAEITISPGTTVVWINTSPTTHTVTDKERRWDSGFLEAGQRYQMTFDTPGEYAYWCLLHPNMEGKVIVR